MNYPMINSYIAVNVEELKDKLIEEWLEVKAFFLLYSEKDNNFKKRIVINLIAELHDLAQIISTFSYSAILKLSKTTKINLSANDLINCIKNKVEYIYLVETREELFHILNHAFDFVINLIRIICIDNDIYYLESFNNHIEKLRKRGVV